MALDSYANLKTSIKDWLDQGDELDAYLDDFIDLAEARHVKDQIRTRDMIERATLAIASGARYVDLPTDFVAMRFLRVLNPVTGAGQRYINPSPKFVNDERMAELSSNTDGPPCAYTIHEQIELDREADQAYDGEIFYYKQVTALDGTNTTNTILTNHPDLYLYAALVAAEPFLLNDERIDTWEKIYISRKEALRVAEINARHGGPQASQVKKWVP